jgi:hypothetical protein
LTIQICIIPLDIKNLGDIMKKMFLLFSHKLTSIQENDAKNSLGIEEFVYLPKDLQELWSNVPPKLEMLYDYLKPLEEFLLQHAKENDIILIQGDFGGVHNMVNFSNENRFIPVHSTTTRDVEEKILNGKVEKFSRFEHIIYRKY